MFAKPSVYTKYFTVEFLSAYVFSPAATAAEIITNRYWMFVSFISNSRIKDKSAASFSLYYQNINNGNGNVSVQWKFNPGRRHFEQVCFVFLVRRYFETIIAFEERKQDTILRYENDHQMQTLKILHDYQFSRINESEEKSEIISSLKIDDPLKTVLMLYPEYLQHKLNRTSNYLPKKLPHAEFGFWMNISGWSNLSKIVNPKVPERLKSISICFEDIFENLELRLCPKTILFNPKNFKTLTVKGTIANAMIGKTIGEQMKDQQFCTDHNINQELQDYFTKRFPITTHPRATKETTESTSKDTQETANDKASVVIDLEEVHPEQVDPSAISNTLPQEETKEDSKPHAIDNQNIAKGTPKSSRKKRKQNSTESITPGT